MPIRLAALPSGRSDTERARVLIIDDSVVARAAIERIITINGQIDVVAKVPHVDAAEAYLRHARVDVILLDHEMPGRSGLDGLPAILGHAHGARVAILSGHCARGSERAVRALALGASDVIPKPDLRAFNDGFAEMLGRRILRLAMAARADGDDKRPHDLRPVPPGFRLACLGIGASTGGIYALSRLLRAVRGPLGVPVLVTQHLPADFIPYFVEQLARISPMPVALARRGDAVLPDRVIVASGQGNLVCVRRPCGTVEVGEATGRAGPLDSLPALNPMFGSMAQCYGAGALALVLTGMGRDGATGAKQVAAAGGLVLAQDRASSVVWGMPGYVTRAGVVSALLDPAAVPGYLDSLAMRAAA